MSSAGADLTAEQIQKVVAELVREHPRHFLVLCHESQYEVVVAAVEEAKPDDVTVEVKAHKYCERGRAYVMRHPDDFQTFGKIPFEVSGGSGLGEAFPSAASA